MPGFGIKGGILCPILMKMGPSGPSLIYFKHKAHFRLGVKANVQLKSSIPIGAKVEISPKVFTLGVKAEIQKIIFNLPQVNPSDSMNGISPACN
jgi:hypothetical protein